MSLCDRHYRPRRALAATATAWFTTLLATIASGQQTTLDASQLAFRSTGTVAGSEVTLSQNGFLGTYIMLGSPGAVNFTVTASGVADANVSPRLNLVVDDYRQNFNVAAGANAYNGSVTLPAGTHFVRLEYDNDAPTAAARALTLKNVSIAGATIANAATDANALAAADTYINHYRKGDARIALTGPGDVPLLEGTNVRAKMVRNAFNFGGTVSGSSLDDQKDMLGIANPAAGTQQQIFQDFVKKNFNMVVGSNSGKWSNNESAQNNVNMSLPDRQLDWAVANHKRARMHNLMWGDGVGTGKQQPAYINALIASAAGGDANAKTQLRAAISNRIKYFAGANGNRSLKCAEIDGLNESLHNPSYMNIFGNDGMADIYQELGAAIKAAGSSAKMYLNEYNVLQYSPAAIDPVTAKSTGFDPYANYYRQHNDDLRAAGADLGGIGIQYYGNFTQTGTNAHSAATIQKALGALGVAGLPISMTEFGGANSMGLAQNAAGVQVLDDAMRMFFGHPQATTFLIWGWWDVPENPTPPAALLDNTKDNRSLTPMGVKWEQLMAEFSTDVTGAVGADGKLSFNGFFGDYNIGNQAGFSNLTLAKGTTDYTLKLDAPPGWSLFTPASDGTWTSATSWSAGVPNGTGITAHFLPSVSARTITLDTNLTLGQVNLDGAPTRISGGGDITLQAVAGLSALNVIDGSHEISVPLTLAGDARAVVRDPSSKLTLRSLADAPTRSLTKRGDGTLAVDHVRLASLSIEGGRVSMLSGSPRINIVDALTIADGTALDVNDSIWAVDGDRTASFEAVRGLIAGGRITSSSTQDGGRAIGWAAAANVAGSVLTGTDLSVNVVVFRATWRGDTNLDGVVDVHDLVTLAQNYDAAVEGRSWSDGDFNRDGRVDFDDLVALVQNYGTGRSSLPGVAGRQSSISADQALSRSLSAESATVLTTVSFGHASAHQPGDQ